MDIIDGKKVSSLIKIGIKSDVNYISRLVGRTPFLSVVLVGENSASQSYVSSKEKSCFEVGIKSKTYKVSSEIKEDDLVKLISEINSDDSVDAILVQLPLPKHINTNRILSLISPSKDVDGFNPISIGKLFSGDETGSVPCTPLGIIHLIETTGIKLAGANAVIVGRSNIVGKPTAALLLNRNATVTVCHSKTKTLADYTKTADILVVAVGSPKLVTASMVKPGAVVVDVGINRLDGKLVGDVDFEGVKEVAGYITPVPGGVGPMTIAMLLSNTVRLFKQANGI